MDESIRTRASLINRLKDWRDEESWQDFVDTYSRLIERVARKAGLTGVEVQEVLQETLIAVSKRMPKFRYDPAVDSFRGWLLTTTRWRIRSQLRKRDRYISGAAFFRNEESSTGLVEKIPDPSTQLDALWTSEWEESVLEVALSKVKRRVDPRNFQMFDLYVSKEWAAAKVAAAFGVKVSQVYLAKHRVTEALKEEVQRLKTGMA